MQYERACKGLCGHVIYFKEPLSTPGQDHNGIKHYYYYCNLLAFSGSVRKLNDPNQMNEPDHSAKSHLHSKSHGMQSDHARPRRQRQTSLPTCCVSCRRLLPTAACPNCARQESCSREWPPTPRCKSCCVLSFASFPSISFQHGCNPLKEFKRNALGTLTGLHDQVKWRICIRELVGQSWRHPSSSLYS